MQETNRYTITWHCNAVKLGRNYISLGICERTNQVAFLSVFQPNKSIGTEFLTVLIVQKVYAGKECEDGTSCLNLDCPLNHVEVSNFKRYKIKTMQEIQNLHRRMKEIQEQLKLEINSEGETSWYNKPLIIIRKAKKGS
jgi:hypothetical protein